jgi:DNA repair exonuclease SbcCD nuclease subunit
MRCAFIADTGTGDSNQRLVGKGLSKLVKDKDIKFILLGGDNFYENGCKDKNDILFKTAFEIPYKNIPNDIKFFGCLGNHCIHHPNGHNAQFDYSDYSIEKDMKFILPYHFYDFGKRGLFRAFVIDSNLENMNEKLKKEQSRTISKKIRESKEPWKILMCHHPLMSPGEHGNLEEPHSTYLKNIIKNGIDLICSGHDHLQACIKMKIKNKGVIQVVNGAGAKEYYDSDEYVHPEYINNKRGCELLHENTQLGYCMFDIKPKSLEILYFDKNNNELFKHKISK